MSNSMLFLCMYVPLEPMVGKRGKILKWHPEKRMFHAFADDVAIREGHARTPKNGLLAKIDHIYTDPSGRKQRRTVYTKG